MPSNKAIIEFLGLVVALILCAFIFYVFIDYTPYEQGVKKAKEDKQWQKITEEYDRGYKDEMQKETP